MDGKCGRANLRHQGRARALPRAKRTRSVAGARRLQKGRPGFENLSLEAGREYHLISRVSLVPAVTPNILKDSLESNLVRASASVPSSP